MANLPTFEPFDYALQVLESTTIFAWQYPTLLIRKHLGVMKLFIKA